MLLFLNTEYQNVYVMSIYMSSFLLTPADMIFVMWQVLFEKANLAIERGEKIAIIGPNGCGKSTLLKLIMSLQKPVGGEVMLGEHNVLPNYFEQNQVCNHGMLIINGSMKLMVVLLIPVLHVKPFTYIILFLSFYRQRHLI